MLPLNPAVVAATVVLFAITAELTPFIVTPAATGGLIALSIAVNCSVVLPAAAPVASRSSPTLSVLVAACGGLDPGPARKTDPAIVAVAPFPVVKPCVGVSTPGVRTKVVALPTSPCSGVCGGNAPSATPAVYEPSALSISAFATRPVTVLGLN